MIKRIVFLLKYTLFWVLLFAFARVLFESYNITKTVQLPISEILLSFVHGIRLDMSLTGYFILFIGLLVSLSIIINPKYLKYPINIVTYFLIFYTLLISIIDLELYRNWGFRMDSTPLVYLNTPSEALASTPIWLIITLSITWLSISIFACWIYKKQISYLIEEFPKSKWYGTLVLILFTALYFIPVRGTFSVAPINAGTVYFSSNQFANHAAVNVTWNFSDAIARINKRQQEVQLISYEEASLITKKLYSKQDSTLHLLNTSNPNVIFIVLESFTSDGVEFFGGLKDITPNLNQLAKEGISFTNIYATGSRSDKGLVGILSGYPSQLGVSIMNFPNKTRNLPSLAKNFDALNYSTSFYYGGDANFANINSYMLNVGFKEVKDVSSVPSKFERNSKWGIHDHLMFNYLLEETDNEKESFFKVLFTLSSHEPFDVPMKTAIAGSDLKSQFLNSMHYTDESIGNFIELAKTKPWWKNTLIVLIADHSGRFPYDREIHLPERYAIPMIWLGGALDSTGVINNTIGGQQDVAATILGQLDIKHDEYLYSRDILAHNDSQFALYLWANGLGYKTDKGSIAFSTDTKKVFWQTGDTLNLEQQAKALFQVYSNDFNNKEIELK